ncbi:bifunctional acetate--CoA ligase family protein/GNAT family N-acetyltransferase [Roseimaritima ulvae]|uniref:Succinyl-CoA ligase [ADP-forming] subunit alpha n=1 Tax=Roseimaritima ulvae TaxID=980254 RepID=A0A5B9QLT5_9BACT|nr:bifunctional acetate--CoA ligase family protein/GNAT family N-acetyltransferase [Roseimaritima ulvae]QEG40037.1 Succinyl-CoA ligase [ADP-forming] subunit alpha [Roseimaritima ulvae]
MPIKNLDKIFAARSVAVVGASNRLASVGHTVFANLRNGGFGGPVYAVNPNRKTIGDQPCFASVGDLPPGVDLAVICTPAATVAEIVRQCGEAGILGVVIVSAGFREISAAGRQLEEAIGWVAKEYPGLRIVGPNCLGIMSPHLGLNASFAHASPLKGQIAFISQSGALCTAVLDWALQENVGFSHFVSVGNMLDVGVADLIDYFGTDPWTKSIILYVESISDARKFMSAARAFTRTKPIIAYKAGRFTESAQAAASHTGAMAGVDSVYEAAFARAGVERVFDVEELFDCAELLATQKTPTGPRLAIITNAGGPGVMATDTLLACHGKLAQLSDETIAQLNQALPAAWSHGNPVDILGDAPPERFAAAVKLVLADKGVDGVLVVLSPQAMTDPTGTAEAVIETTRHSFKPVLAAWMGGRMVYPGVQQLNAAGIPNYTSPEKAIRAFMHLVSYAKNRETLYETPREVPIVIDIDRQRLREVFAPILSNSRDVLSEPDSKTLLEAYQIPITQTLVARSAEQAVHCAKQVGYPVVLKIFSPDITHKTDVGGVELNLADADQVRAAYQRILANAHSHLPDAQLEGVTVQHMLVVPSGHELIIGAKRDPVFGTVLLVGAGGTNAELFRDHALELPPLSEPQARRILQSLQSWPLLEGYRGRPGVDIDRLVKVLMRLSYLVADCPEIVELDVNPLLATADDVIALDARIVLDRQTTNLPVRPYSHLAIRPYPNEFSRHATLKDGSQVLLRPIKPEDEPMWHALVNTCSPETIRLRFRCMFKSTTHKMAARFCFIDYDREIAIVAEREEKGERKLLGVGRLVADADHQMAEFAILVGDPWQGLGLGSLLTDYCLDICKRWGIRRVVAEMAPENYRMLQMFSQRGFEIDRSRGNDVVITRKALADDPTNVATGDYSTANNSSK